MTDKPREPSKEALEIIAMFYELKDERDAALAERDDWRDQCEETFKTMKMLEAENYTLKDKCKLYAKDINTAMAEVDFQDYARERYKQMCEKLAEALSCKDRLLETEALAEYRAFKGEK